MVEVKERPEDARRIVWRTGAFHPQSRHNRRRPDGQRHRACLRALRALTFCSTICRRAHRRGARHHRRESGPPGQPPAHQLTSSARPRSSGSAPAQTLDELADCDLVIEAATEKEDVKRKIFTLSARLKSEAIVATNTSSISITRLAAATDRPERFIGIHFINPVPLMELVEVIRGIATDDLTFELTKQFITKLGKQIAVSRGFSRLHRPPRSACRAW